MVTDLSITRTGCVVSTRIEAPAKNADNHTKCDASFLLKNRKPKYVENKANSALRLHSVM